MNGPEHYRDAEYLLNKMPVEGVSPDTGLDRAETLAAAQVHATLALAAATAWPAVHDWLGEEDRSGHGWTGIS